MTAWAWGSNPRAPKRVRLIRSSSAPSASCASARRSAWSSSKLREKRARLYGDDPNGPLGGLNAFYLLVDNPEVYGLPANPQLPSNRLKQSGAFSVATAAVLGLLAVVGIRKRRMDEKEGVMNV